MSVPPTAGGPDATALLRAIERFLYQEAALLDERDLESWLALFADDGHYRVPASRDGGEPASDVSIVYDDRRRLANRVAWLTSNRAFAQQPPSATVRQITNVVVDRIDAELIEASAVAVVWEVRPNTTPQEVASRVRYRLRAAEDDADNGAEFLIVEKRVDLLDPSRHWENLTFLP